MATRAPLVRNATTGRTEELPAGDTVPGGGGAALFTATLTIAPAQYHTATVSVVDAAVTPATLIIATLAPNDDHDADDLEDLKVTAEAGTGTINFSIHALGAIVGFYKVVYQKG
jgi:hypothetical protein